MRRRGALVVLTTAVIGCGGGHHATPTAPKAVTLWIDEAVAYAQAIETCNVRVSPAPGFWPGCIRTNARLYDRAEAQALRGLAACPSKARRAHAMIRAVGAALRRDSRAMDHLLRAGHADPGPAPAVLDDRAQTITRRDVAAVRRLAPSLRC
jgi:hypothetical protein